MPLIAKPRKLAGKAAVVLAAGTAASAPLLVGAAHPPAVVGLCAVSVLALLLHVAERVQKRRPIALSWLGLPLFIGVVASAFQLLPLPELLRAFFSPAGTDELSFVTSALSDEGKAFVRPVLSLDPPQTALALLRLLAASCVFIVLADRSRHRQERRLAYRILLAGGLALFLVAIGHRLANVEQIWGVYKTNPTVPLYAPLVNPNHLSRMFGAFSLLALGRAFVVRSRTEALWFGMVTVLCGAGVFLTLSRGGILVFVAVLFVFGVVVMRAPSHDDAPSSTSRGGPGAGGLSRLVGVQLAGLSALAVGLYLAREAIVDEITTVGDESLETSKAKLYGPALRLLKHHWRTGVGDGAFQTAFPSVLELGELSRVTFTHAENIVVQTLVEHGAIVGGGLLVLALVVLGTLLSSLTSRGQLAAVPALLFLVLADFFDFALEIGAGILLVGAALGLAAGRALEVGRTRVRLRIRYSAALAVVALALFAWKAQSALVETRYPLLKELASLEPSTEARTRGLERALALHPHDGYLAYLLAVDAREHRDLKRALAFANRSMVLWPNLGGAHVEAARALAVTGRLDQALLEYRLAAESQTTPIDRLLNEVALRTPDVEKRMQALPVGDAAARAGLCAVLVREKRLDDAQACYDRAREDFGADPVEQGKFALAAIRLAVDRKDGAGALERIAALGGDANDGELLKSRIAALEIENGAVAALDEPVDIERLREPVPYLQWRLSTAMRLGRESDALSAIAQLRKRTADRRQLDGLDAAEASVHEKAGRLGDALKLRRQLVRRNPRSIPHILSVARTELALGLAAEAKLTLDKAVRLEPERDDVVRLGIAIDLALDKAREEKVREIVDERGR